MPPHVRGSPGLLPSSMRESEAGVVSTFNSLRTSTISARLKPRRFRAVRARTPNAIAALCLHKALPLVNRGYQTATSGAKVLTNGNSTCILVDEMRKAKRIRERLNLTLLEVHEKTGITPSHLNRFENNKRLM